MLIRVSSYKCEHVKNQSNRELPFEINWFIKKKKIIFICLPLFRNEK